MRATMMAVVLAGTVAASGAAAMGQGSYSTNIGAAFNYPASPVQFHGDNRTSQFPFLGISTCSSASSRSASSGSESIMSSVDRGLIEHTTNGSGSRAELHDLPGRYDGFTCGATGSSSATWTDVVVSYTGEGEFATQIPVSASFSVIATMHMAGENIVELGYNVSTSASINGQGGSFGAHIGGGGAHNASGAVTIVGALVPVNTPFTVSMALSQSRSPYGVGFGGAYDHPPGSVSWGMNASIATNGPSFGEPVVFVLPEGYTVNSPSMGVVNNRWLGRTVFIPCGPSDVGSAGGVDGADSVLDNNDFIAYISRYFAADMRADVGRAGGVAGTDGVLDNNDFIAFITGFFDGCGGN